MRLLLQLLFPLGVIVERVFGERWLAFFIRWNNRLIEKRITALRGEVFILAPSCLQRSGCDAKIVGDAGECRRCGECAIRDLVELAEGLGTGLEIVSGGRLAKEMVKRRRPKAVLAIACERELATGIFHTYPLPVYGILNTRPMGPCRDTQVDMDAVYRVLGMRDEVSNKG